MSKPLIWGVMPYYEMNEIFHVAQKSMMNTVDNGIGDRGKWKGYPKNSGIDYCFNYETEMEHRNVLINQIPVGDYFITWDSDLVFFGDVGEFTKIRNRRDPVVWFNLFKPNGKSVKWACMFIKHFEMEYAINHFSIFYNNHTIPIRIKFDPEFDQDYNLNFFDLGHLKSKEEREAKEVYKLKRIDKMNYREAYR